MKVLLVNGSHHEKGCTYTALADNYSKHLDDKLAEFSKAIIEKMDTMQNTVAQYGAPTGLKGKMGADKDAKTEPQVFEFSRQGAGIRTALY